MLSPSSDVAGIIDHLGTLRSEENIAGMGRFGIVTDAALGISNPDLQKIAHVVKRDHARALDLWNTGIREARMVAIYTADPKALTSAEAHSWADDFASWEIVDAAADLFTEAPFWQDLIAEFAEDEREFVRRTAFAMIAGASVHLKKEPDATLIGCLRLIEQHSTDPRNFVKKAVNWALRNIGKRNVTCHKPALALAQKLAESNDKTARWIGKDALKELSGEKVMRRLKV
ncbi:DNA alkylation repair protein [Aliirhizobium cellulosilyticum]|jgi:3-methyladenine DNA glycosylase AlkD|uniref:3-methyladenine DNA glycosylase AlkD n=1 Tax=Aliirhizobium cellulosilyticum TaxID=393664 RepID=A0A7W6WNV2_9HYPH|nr:DNA alkylation repair protein [Rhizobium cellulosilyticum]MBB4347748.1 3-methyladenine DNA glycosylase AlkD [Rhizobium cellulosilyticum]MBB4409858.1 3-methyladenine DNA glycosylase AlkD [Rhizobium cellulosilyticum]MBB4444545.1 3-methyladenine DNA glycosylase AlkD [Rhizobium cellulosilyticum]